MKRKSVTYALRLWCDGEREAAWRASLENLQTKERVNFSSVDKLVCFLKTNQQQLEAEET